MSLVIALMSLTLLAGLAGSLAVIMHTELRVVANYATSRETMYAADGVLQIAAQQLLEVADWNALMSSGALSSFVDGPADGLRPLGDGTTVDLTQATIDANGEPRPWGANNPIWRLFAFGWLGPRTYVIAWVGDDFAENDGDPRIDGNSASNPGAGILAVRAEAFGVGHAHKVLEMTLRRDVLEGGSAAIRILSWHEIR